MKTDEEMGENVMSNGQAMSTFTIVVCHVVDFGSDDVATRRSRTCHVFLYELARWRYGASPIRFSGNALFQKTTEKPHDITVAKMA